MTIYFIVIPIIHTYTHIEAHIHTTPLFFIEFFQVFCVKTCWFRVFQALIACWLLINQVLSRYSARFLSFSNPLSRFRELIHATCTRFWEFFFIARFFSVCLQLHFEDFEGFWSLGFSNYFDLKFEFWRVFRVYWDLFRLLEIIGTLLDCVEL